MTSAATWSCAEVLAALETLPARLAVASSAAATRPVPDGEWGANEVVRHLIACEVVVHQSRLADLAAQETPRWGWAEPGPWPGEPGLTLDELLERFTAVRRATLATVGALDEAGWARHGTHATLGVFDVRALLANAVDHDEMHVQALL